MPSLFEFHVQLIEQDIGQQRTQWAALRHAHQLFLKVSLPRDRSRFEIFEDERQQARIGDALPQPTHQFLVIDGVEELLQIAIDHMAPLPLFLPFLCHLCDGIVRAAHRPEAEWECR